MNNVHDNTLIFWGNKCNQEKRKTRGAKVVPPQKIHSVTISDRLDMSDEDENCDCREDPNFNKKHRSFHVFTSPLDMERFFNQQMDDMLKSFGVFGAFTDKNNEETFPGSNMPEFFQGKGQEYNDKNESGERDFMLKKDHDEKLKTPGYIPQATEEGNFWAGSRERAKDNSKTDKDLDQNGINSAELDKLFKHPQSSGSAESIVQTPFGDWNNGTGSIFGHFFRNSFPNRTPFEQVSKYN